jgi:hypothetical protein
MPSYGQPSVVTGGGELVGFTSSVNTSVPNDTVNVARLLADTVSTNADIVIAPKGNGSIIGWVVPSGVANGGNKRGQYSIDLQGDFKIDSNEVVSGNYSFSIGMRNIVSGDYTAVLGQANNISGDFGLVEGLTNTATGNHIFVLGRENTADSDYSVAIGYKATTRDTTGKTAIGYRRSNLGDSQLGILVVNRLTSNATPNALTVGGGVIDANNILLLPDNSCYLIRALVTAKTVTAGGRLKTWEIVTTVKRDTGAATTAIIHNEIKNLISSQGSVSSWEITSAVDTTNGGFYLLATGVASTNISWSATLISCENVY